MIVRNPAQPRLATQPTYYLNSPYGRVPLPSGGSIRNGRPGRIVGPARGKGMVVVKFECTPPVDVAEDWLSLEPVKNTKFGPGWTTGAGVIKR